MIFVTAMLLAAAPEAGAMRCPEGSTYSKTYSEESCLDSLGQLTGPQELRSESGVLIKRSLYRDGKPESETLFFVDGTPQTIHNWQKGHRDGVWEEYYEPKKLAWRRVYAADKLTKETIFDRAGVEQKPPKVFRDGGVGPGGGLSKEILLWVITRHQNEVKFCYEKQLQKKPTLAGKLSIGFTIGSDGRVAEAKDAEDSVDDPLVTNCIVERIKRWEFPRPLGGGNVSVTFPWIFVPADGGTDD